MPIRLPLSSSFLAGGALLFAACATANNDPLIYGAGTGEMTGGSGPSSGGGAGTGTGGTSGTGGTDSTTGGTGGAAGGSGGATGGAGSASGGTGGSTAGAGGATGGTGGATGGMGGTGKSTAGTGPVHQASIPLPYTDDFEDGNDDDWFADKANPSTDAVGDWGVVDDGGNHVYQAKTAFDDESWTVGGDRNWTDVRIEARVRFDSESSDGDGMIYLAGRWAPGDRDYYWVEFRSAGKPKVRRKTDGSSDDIVTLDIDDIVAGMGAWHTLALTLKGGEVILELDGMVLGTGTDSAPLARGGIALGTRDCVASFDDIEVTAP